MFKPYILSKLSGIFLHLHGCLSCYSELDREDGSESDGEDDRGNRREGDSKLPGFFENEFKKRRKVLMQSYIKWLLFHYHMLYCYNVER